MGLFVYICIYKYIYVYIFVCTRIYSSAFVHASPWHTHRIRRTLGTSNSLLFLCCLDFFLFYAFWSTFRKINVTLSLFRCKQLDDIICKCGDGVWFNHTMNRHLHTYVRKYFVHFIPTYALTHIHTYISVRAILLIRHFICAAEVLPTHAFERWLTSSFYLFFYLYFFCNKIFFL